MNAAVYVGFAAASVRVGTPLALAAVGETIAERSGVINLGIEGAMLAGAFAAAAAAASTGVLGGTVAAIAAGVVVGLCLAAIVVGARADQIIAGTAMTLAAVGLTGLLAQRVWGTAGAGLSLPTMKPFPLPGLHAIPVVGEAFFDQTTFTYACYLLIPGASWLLFRTRFGRALRASGESPSVARAAGVRVGRARVWAITIGGATAGLAGASLVLAQVGTFTERMTAGRGFIALAIVALGRWSPWGVAGASLLFGAATALQYLFEAAGSPIPYQVFLAAPYLLALLVMAIFRHRQGPAALGQSH